MPTTDPARDASPGTAPVPAGLPREVTAGRVREAVEGLGLRYFVDDEGDVGIPWRPVTVHVLFQDTRAVQVRGAWHRVASIEHLGELRALVEEWNATRIAPKAYLTVSDEGVVRLHGEMTHPLEGGMTDEQLGTFLSSGCRHVLTLMRAAEDAFPDPLRGDLGV